MNMNRVNAAAWLWIATTAPLPAQELETGIALAEQGDLKGAEQQLRAALRLNPEPARVHYELGRIYEKQGDPLRAITEYKAGIRRLRQGRP